MAPAVGSYRRQERWAGGLSIFGGVIHGALTPAHLDEWWGYGLFFFFAAAAQILYGIALLTDAIDPKLWGPGWEQAKRNLLLLGIAGNLAIISLYLVTRTVGIPFFGPEAGEIEAVAPIDVASKATELALVVLLFQLWRHAPATPSA